MSSIDRIGKNYTNSYNNYSKIGKSKNEDVPPFLLDYDENGVFYEKSDDKSNSHYKSKDNMSNRDDIRKNNDSKMDEYQNAVKGESKNNSDKNLVRNSDTKNGASEIETNVSSNFIGDISSIFADTIKILKEIARKTLSFLWYGDDKKNESDSNYINKNEKEENKVKTDDSNTINDYVEEQKESVSDKFTSTALNKYRRDREKKYNEELQNARNGMIGIPARNTTLLTTYDKFGKINKISASDSDIILRGDKSIKM